MAWGVVIAEAGAGLHPRSWLLGPAVGGEQFGDRGRAGRGAGWSPSILHPSPTALLDADLVPWAGGHQRGQILTIVPAIISDLFTKNKCTLMLSVLYFTILLGR